ncbi:kinase-like domain-containing protein [Bombardia bombarda]|uniref:non-specific serine/threonine protein kinase n=1 Tax=Bombardia bombarda TaxID=252184 RepID=A0AA40C8Y3_9PEZI|nr:kinase-like domain-containing protein [Bombardia bombarda]
MSNFLRWLPRLLSRRAPLPPRVYSNLDFERIPESHQVEEERYPDYLAARYYPVRIGEVFASRYQVVGKLGFGAFSTVWLARDLNDHRHVALKVFIRAQAMGSEADHELSMYRHMASMSKGSKHPGRDCVRTLSDSFKVTGPDGEHLCLVHPPLWDTVKDLIARNPIGRLPPVVLAAVLQQLFLALDFMHTECHLVHTDLKSDNVMFAFNNDSIFDDFEQEEMKHPCPRKEVEDGTRVIYTSRTLQASKSGVAPPILCDFGSTVFGNKENTTDVQPNVYRAPEVILGIPWSYEIDMWNVGCMVSSLGPLFNGKDPEHQAYRGRAHIGSMITLLGPPPAELVARGRLSHKLFSEQGTYNAFIPLPSSVSLEEIETNLEGEDKKLFMQVMRKMLQWKPEDRSTAKDMLQDPWIKGQLGT